ncbi:MAG: hypothetical protein CL677_07120 [Bdellovibrionaceae bacterium]|nr:hypothetical protein [Pseudobdellovibrionaceae bacterium]
MNHQRQKLLRTSIKILLCFLLLSIPGISFSQTVRNSSQNQEAQEKLKDIQEKHMGELKNSLNMMKQSTEAAGKMQAELQEKLGIDINQLGSSGQLKETLSESKYSQPLTETEEKVRVALLKFLSVFSDGRVIRALGPLATRFKQKRFHLFGASLVFLLLMWTYRNQVKKQLSSWFKSIAFSIMCTIVSFVGVSIIIPTIFLGLPYFTFIDSVYQSSAAVYKWDTTRVAKLKSYLPKISAN